MLPPNSIPFFLFVSTLDFWQCWNILCGSDPFKCKEKKHRSPQTKPTFLSPKGMEKVPQSLFLKGMLQLVWARFTNPIPSNGEWLYDLVLACINKGILAEGVWVDFLVAKIVIIHVFLSMFSLDGRGELEVIFSLISIGTAYWMCLPFKHTVELQPVGLL